MRRICLLAVVGLLALAPPALAAAEPEGGDWFETYIEPAERGDGGPRLHVDVIRPEGLPRDARTPVILTVSPYTNHSGQPLTPDTRGGPSSRFYDFLAQGRVFERGYTYVMVDLRGTGGSAGCNDWGGPGEQSDVRAAVEWAARQPWSTGRVALMGKSYDAWTGLMALAQRPRGLAAVVAQEPVVDGYRYLYMNRVPFYNRLGTPLIFQVIDAQPGHPLDDPEYQLTSAPRDPACYAYNVADQQNPDPGSAYWRPRNLVDAVAGNPTPTFLMQGFLETNTKPDAVFDLWNNLTGPNHAWFGQFDHVRGYERSARTGESLTGRETFMAEVMRFLDRHVRGVEGPEAATERDPAVTVQAIDGSWRAEAAWPPADSSTYTTTLLGGSYTDDEANNGTAEDGGPNGVGLWTFSQPLPHAVHLAGTPEVEVDVETSAPDANLVANVYDVAPDGTATMISRGAFLVPRSGTHRFELYGQDWPIPAGHRIGVLLTPANDEWWAHDKGGTRVTVGSARIELPFLRFRRDDRLEGTGNPRLRAFREEAPFTVGPDVLAGRVREFALPPALVARPAATEPGPRGGGGAAGGGAPGGGGTSAGTAGGGDARSAGPRAQRRERLTARLHAFARRGSRRRLVVSGLMPRGVRVRVALQRNGRVIARRTLSPSALRRYRIQFLRMPASGRYRAVAEGRRNGERLRAVTAVRRLR